MLVIVSNDHFLLFAQTIKFISVLGSILQDIFSVILACCLRRVLLAHCVKSVVSTIFSIGWSVIGAEHVFIVVPRKEFTYENDTNRSELYRDRCLSVFVDRQKINEISQC